MKLGIYSFLDTQTGMFSLPFFQSHPAIAKRMATDLVSDPETMIGKHPECFALYSIGTFDDNTAQFESASPVMLFNCASLRPPVEYDSDVYGGIKAVKAELSALERDIDYANGKA